MPVYKDHLHGTLDALILKTLSFGPRHGYAIGLWLKERTGDGLQVEEGSLYPALYRMERDGWIDAEWGVSDTGRKAKVYRITEKGRRQLRVEMKAFARFIETVSPLLLPA